MSLLDNKVRISIKGLNQLKLLGALRKSNTCVFDASRVSFDETHLTLYKKDYKKLVENNVFVCYNVTVTERSGASEMLKGVLGRLGLVVGLVLAAAFIVWFSGRTWKISVDVVGENAETIRAEVLQILAENGIKEGAKKTKLENKAIEKLLVNGAPEASLVVADKEGVKLNITIKGISLPKKTIDGKIVARYSGQIVSIRGQTGDLLVNIGDIVSKGQVLICPSATNGTFSPAGGSVMAKVFIAGEAYGKTQLTKMERTGESICQTTISLLGLKLKGKEAAVPYEYYEVETTEILISENLLLPIKKTTTTWYKVAPKVVDIAEEELVQNLKAQAKKVAENNLPKGAEVTGETYTVFNENGFVKVVCNLETMLDIAMRENV